MPVAGFHSAAVNVPRSAGNLLRSVGAGIPLSVYRNRSAQMHAHVERDVTRMDVLFVDHFLMFQYVPRAFTGRVVLHQHNAEHLIWQRYAALSNPGAKRLAAGWEAQRIRSYERDICTRAHVVLAAPNDIESLTAIGVPRERFVETLHLGDEALLQRPNIEFAHTDLRLLYVGSLDWEANRHGLLWFLAEVWPPLLRAHPDLKLTIAGRNADEELTQAVARSPGVELAGFVDDLEPHYSRARVFIAPLRFGGGIKVKVVNALYRGLPQVTTAVGAEGLLVKSGRDLFVADTSEKMAGDISRLLSDETTWTNMRDNARTLAREKYTWETTLSRMESTLHG